MPELTRTTMDLPRSAGPVGPAEYQRVIAGVREAVARTVPPGSIVLVVSRGDEELVRFPNHKGWHFPRAAGGEYGGHHPENSQDAISRLEELRGAGASHIVFPSTAYWWFDYYEAFAGYIQDNARLLVERREACLLFAFEGTIRPSPTPSAPTVGAGEPSQLQALVDALLPGTCDVIVATEEDGSLPRLGGRKIWRFVLPEFDSAVRAEQDDPVSRLKALQSTGPSYLILPRGIEGFVRATPELKAHLDESCRLITRQRHIGAIFRLKAPVMAGQRGIPPNGDGRNGDR